jgi:hypothetical protein
MQTPQIKLYPVLLKHKVIGYLRYVDIMIIYNQHKTNIGEPLSDFNKQRTNIKFTIDKEHGESINFLDITIHHKKTKLEYEICNRYTRVCMGVQEYE